MKIARVQAGGLASPILAMVCDGAFYDVAEVETHRRSPCAWAGRDFHTRLFGLGGAGLAEIHEELLSGHRPSEARLEPGSFVVLPPVDVERAALIELGPCDLPAEEPRFAHHSARALVGSKDPAAILLPVDAPAPHFEAMLAVVLKDELWRGRPAEVERAILGFTLLIAWSSRPARERWHLAASGPEPPHQLGPHLVTMDEAPDLENLELVVSVGDRQRAARRIGDRTFTIAESVAFVSQTVPLRAGDLVGTGCLLDDETLCPGRSLGYGERVELSLGRLLTLTGFAVQVPPVCRWRQR